MYAILNDNKFSLKRPEKSDTVVVVGEAQAADEGAKSPTSSTPYYVLILLFLHYCTEGTTT